MKAMACAMDLSNGAAWMDGDVLPTSEARLPVTDWGLTHSDATYDVAPVWDGAFFRLDTYLDRFEASCAALRLNPGLDRAGVRTVLHRIVAASGLRAAYVSMVCTRGTPTVPGSRDPRDCANRFFAWCVPYVHVIRPEIAATGASLKTASLARRIPETSVDPTVKNYHWGDFTAGLFEAKDEGFDSVLLLDAEGGATEGPGFNIFAVFGNDVVTPARHCLHGITRRTAMEIATDLGFAVTARDLPLAELLEADEAFITTSGGGPVWIRQIDARVFANGAQGTAAARIAEGYWRMMADPNHRDAIDYCEGDS